MGAHVGQLGALADLTRSQLEKAIREACLGEIDEQIARAYLIRHIPHIEIAGELEGKYGVRMDRCTVSRHWKGIKQRITKQIRVG